MESYREKISILIQQITRQGESQEQINARIRNLEEDKCHLEARLHKTESDLSACELTKENLKRDKSIVSTQNQITHSKKMSKI